MCANEATAEEADAFIVVSNEMSEPIPKQITMSSPCHLRVLASHLTTAFTTERAKGAVLNNRQDAVSFKRLNHAVNNLLKAYSLNGSGDWRNYATWNEHNYLRHLLWATEDFEVMLLCWKPGQTSRVHTHANSHCWFAVLSGQMRETQYRPLLRGEEAAELPTAADGSLNLVPTLVTDKTVGDVAYINDYIAIHSVGCCTREPLRPAAPNGSAAALEDGALGCTLHVYCPPIRRAKALEGGRVTETIPGFFSRHSICAA